MPTIRVDANLGQVETRLRRFSDGLLDWRPFWSELGRPSRRRSTKPLAVAATIRTAPRIAAMVRFAVRPGRCF